jgi:hypothetical protein
MRNRFLEGALTKKLLFSIITHLNSLVILNVESAHNSAMSQHIDIRKR